MTATLFLPRGIRNNNPGNLRRDAKTVWAGQSAQQNDTSFVQFAQPVYGLRALMKTLLAYQARHGLDTVRGIVNRYAPPHENATDAYMEAVARRLGVTRDAKLDLRDKAQLMGLAQAIIVQENGRPPRGRSAGWYDPALYAAAADMLLNI